jgi:hypothetical protein
LSIRPEEISDIYVDDKTRNWYVLRYKYEKIFLYGGTGYLLLDVLNTGKINPQTVKLSGILVGASFLAKILVPKRMRIKGKRKLVIVG